GADPFSKEPLLTRFAPPFTRRTTLSIRTLPVTCPRLSLRAAPESVEGCVYCHVYVCQAESPGALNSFNEYHVHDDVRFWMPAWMVRGTGDVASSDTVMVCPFPREKPTWRSITSRAPSAPSC